MSFYCTTAKTSYSPGSMSRLVARLNLKTNLPARRPSGEHGSLERQPGGLTLEYHPRANPTYISTWGGAGS